METAAIYKAAVFEYNKAMTPIFENERTGGAIENKSETFMRMILLNRTERRNRNMKRKLMVWTVAVCICAGLTGNTGAVNVFASEGDSDAVRIGALKGPTAMGMAQLLDADAVSYTHLCRLIHMFQRENLN